MFRKQTWWKVVNVVIVTDVGTHEECEKITSNILFT